MAPSRHDWKIVDWNVKPQHNQPTLSNINRWLCVKDDQLLQPYSALGKTTALYRAVPL